MINNQLFIENYEVDISKEVSALMNFEIDNIRNFAERSTAWSKTIVLPGTARNNKIFGHIFQIGQANRYNDGLPNVNYNFNAAKSADCILFQNQLQSFRGVIRLMQINIDKGKIEYEVALFGEIALLNVALSGKYLNDLDFSAYNHNWTIANITASWDATPGTGYFYPLIDYGQVSVDKRSFDIRAFRPALFVREYIDKMLDDAGFRWESALFDTTRFKRLIIPHNKKELISIADQILSVERTTNATYSPNSLFAFNNLVTTGAWTVGGGNTTFTFVGAGTPVSGTLFVKIEGEYYSTTDTIYIYIYKNGSPIMSRPLPPTGSSTPVAINIPFTLTGGLITPGDVLSVGVEVISPTGTSSLTVKPPSRMTFVCDQPIVVPVSYGGAITMHDCIPNNVKQLDFLVGIVQLFNLYVYEDINDKRLIYFKPYVDFYSTSSLDAVDWTYKLNRNAPMKIKPMSELNAKTYSFRFKPDDDYWNRLYRERYRDGYGDHVFNSEYEFSQVTDQLEIVFSATPLVGYTGEDKVFSAIYKMSGVDLNGRGIEERIDTNIRIMQCKKISAVTSYNIYDGEDNFPGGILGTAGDYGYAGHFDDPDAPDNDINFGTTRELFFILAAGNPANTQFNVYWSAYMAEITDKDSKLLTARFYLTPADIVALDFSKLINIDGILYRLNAIKDYNASEITDCEVELLKVNYLIY